MNGKRWVQLAALGVGCLAATTSGWGYVHIPDAGGQLLLKRYRTPVTLHLSVPGAPRLSDGGTFRSSVADALAVWNAYLGAVQLTVGPSVSPDYSLANGRNEIALDATVGGDAFPSGALAVTISYANGNEIAESDIVFNSTYTWDSYRGALRTAEDVRRVAVHELGHVLGLNHPDEEWQSVTAIMNSRVSSIELPQADDIAGVQALYGVPGVRPANDDFARATSIDPTSDWARLEGSNIGASRESGEPGHAGATSQRSVWFRWTSPQLGQLIVTTAGSNFDTVLAVYTGAAVSALTLVASNDDAEPPAQNPQPTRIRTSKVEVQTTAGTEYRFAVDGWGDADHVPEGYTGAIVLNLEFQPTLPPVIAWLSGDAAVEEGGSTSFSIQVESATEVSYQWQRRRRNNATWENLAENSVYSGTRTSQLTVQATFAMDGDQFRCVARNVAGSVNSEAATLQVTRMPPPIFLSQPASMSVISGDTAGFRVWVQNANRLQWFHDGVAIAGATSETLWLRNAQVADAGDYHVAVSNLGSTVNSATVRLSVAARPEVLNVNAIYQEIQPGGVARLRVAAAGEGTLRYQWYHDGRPVAGATGESYDVPVRTATDAGAYWAAVTDRRGTRHGAPYFVVLARGAVGAVAWGGDGWGRPLQAQISADLTGATTLTGANSVFALGPNGVPRQINWDGGDLIQQLEHVVGMVSVGYTLIGLTADGTVYGPWPADNAPFGLERVVQMTAGWSWGWALHTDGTVTSWSEGAPPTAGLKDVVAIAAGTQHGVALKRDGTVVQVPAKDSPAPPALPTSLSGVVQIAAAGESTMALKSDGTVVVAATDPRLAAPAGLKNVIAIAAGSSHAMALRSDGTVVAWGASEFTDPTVPRGLGSVFSIAANPFGCFALREIRPGVAPIVASPPQNQFVGLQDTLMLSVYAAGPPVPTYEWRRNGVVIPGATESTLQRTVGFSDAGLYTAVVSSGDLRRESSAAIVGLWTPEKAAGAAKEVGTDIRHPNGNTFDQVLLNGSAAAVTCDRDLGQITRLSFVDLDGDIVQVEFSGAGTLSLVLDGSSGPAAPEKYHQPDVLYVQGHAGIVIAGADETTNVSVFTVGRATAYDPTGHYDITKPISATNNPANNGSPLFTGDGSTDYDGIADLAFIAISSTNRKFGGVRAANAMFFAERGHTGIYAPGVEFTGPVYVGDVSAFDDARPVLMLGAAADVRVTGGDMLQANSQPVEVSGITQLRFASGSDSHGHALPAQRNRGSYQQNGADVTSRIVRNP